MITLFLIALGGAVGSAVRYGIGRLVQSRGYRPYMGTMVINAAGSLLIGIVAGLYSHNPKPALYFFIAVGLLGGFTTFSTFMVQLVTLARQRSYGEAIRYGIGSLAAGFALTSLGYAFVWHMLN
ncbi:fluoride efflux transporter FluC [Paenibacillus spongiae]|uniref:Fluoride-specific ion channel FluC n=1 Tax=Paenibacillus spongiae TaxID=2909671 RepID=A0ABY5S4W3_9BACL|nr:CrcB family protein [Paenibacillus spongiae]UVI27880.1 CrcB family protein [Paenibacillus spongiae]